MEAMPPDIFHALVTDPPYGLAFMNRGWDDSGVERDPRTWSAALRVLKPGAHLLAFGGTRTFHRTACAIEDAGFELRPTISWLFGSGFPKSLDVARAIDRQLGHTAEREGPEGETGDVYGAGINVNYEDRPRYEPQTETAAKWSGWGTALKPGWEPIIVARKPFAGTVAANVLAHGTGGINIDATRIATADDLNGGAYSSGQRRATPVTNAPEGREPGGFVQPSGRWPADVILSHSLACVEVGARTVRGDGHFPALRGPSGYSGGWRGGEPTPEASLSSETVEAFDCAPDCPVAELDRQSGATLSSGGRASAVGMHRFREDEKPPTGGSPGIGDFGGASRFYYCAKASTSEREAWGRMELEARRRSDGREKDIENPRLRTTQRINDHVSVKPIALMEWLLRLVVPAGGRVLDPFAGSGSTLVAARRLRIDAVGIEMDERSARIAAHRLRAQWEVTLGI